MFYGLLAGAVVLAHVSFVVFVVAGGLLVLRWPRVAWLHLPAAVWGVAIEMFGWICPLTTVEQRLRQLAGGEGYGGGFIEHYVVPLLYPAGLTRGAQVSLGLAALGLNVVVYSIAALGARRRAATNPGGVSGRSRRRRARSLSGKSPRPHSARRE